MKLKKIFLIALITGILTGGLLTYLFPVGDWWIGWMTGAFLMGLTTFVLLAPLKWLNVGKEGLWLTVAAFAIRLVISIGFMLALPAWGYDNEIQEAGYLFKDAYNRDTAAWELADSGEPLTTVFDQEFFTDQYGGLAFISALVYRIFSPDAHRPYLLLIIPSFAFALGIPFFYSALKQRFDPKLALIASWLVVLYPEGIFFTASQMREPFMIGGLMILLWGMLNWFKKEKRKHILLICVPIVLVLLTISWLMLGAALLLLIVWFSIEWVQKHLPVDRQKMGYIVILLVVILAMGGMAFVSREWLRVTIWWDMREMLLTSGHIELMVEGMPVALQYAVITVYGVLQMVPPAALIESSAPLWKAISVLRSVGWYLFLPVLIFGVYALWKKESRKERSVLVWLTIFTWAWIIFSSLRGGGDTWDNPRYRMLALPVMAILVVWFFGTRDHWLWRLTAVMGFALAVFTHWYIARYIHWFKAISMTTMILMIVGVAFLALLSGILAEIKRKKLN